MSEPFSLLHPSLRHHIINTLGWSGLRPVQAESVAPILNGDNVVILAPTAGGKTEAAFFPMLTRMLSEDWSGLSVLYLSPIRALLNNQRTRLEKLGGMLGRSVGIWHGDIGQSQRERMRREPPDILLTTPESLEAMLISTRTSPETMFASLRAVVIDEVHAFAGADRGWHLLGVLMRLSLWAKRDIQRIGLSATVGNRTEIVKWLSSNSSRTQTTVDPAPQKDRPTPEVTLDWVKTLDNAAHIIAALHRGQRRLVFCDSRIQAERLTRLLRARQQTTHLIHSSLSAGERQRTENAFADGAPGVIVATSALELGIDIGSLDRVIGIDAPYTVASFLQRMGRTGRRQGSVANMLLLAISREGLWRGAALLELWRAGFVEHVQPPAQPLHLLAQQMLALVLEQPGIPIDALQTTLEPFRAAIGASQETAAAIIQHLFDTQVLMLDGARVGMGKEGEQQLGRRHYMKLVSVFTTPPLFRIFHGRRELGTVHQATFMGEPNANRPRTLLLGGRTWRVKSIHWTRRTAQVEPFDAASGGTRWLGASADLSSELATAHHTIAAGIWHAATHYSRRATTELEALREDFAFINPTGLTFAPTEKGLEVWTFAGDMQNRTLAAHLHKKGIERVSSDGLKLTLFGGRSVEESKAAFKSAVNAQRLPEPPADHPMLRQIKFGQLLPPAALRSLLQARLYTQTSAQGVLISRLNQHLS